MQILKQFKSNNQSVAVVLDDTGRTIGMLSLDNIMETIFGKVRDKEERREAAQPQLIIDRTFPGDMTVGEFNQLFNVKFDDRSDLTLAELVIEQLGHMPEEGESIYIEPFEMSVKETTLREIKTIAITTQQV